MKKNDTFIGTCLDYTADGHGVVKDQDFVFFVPGLLVGEEAEIGITALKKSYGFGRVIRILKESPERVKPVCSVYPKCGGCALLHMSLAEQMRFKQEKVQNCFIQNHVDVNVLPVLYTAERSGYRNKVQIPVQVKNGKTVMGFYRTHSNDAVDYDYCYAQSELSNKISSSLKQWFGELGCANVMRHVLIRHAHFSGQVMVCLIVKQYPFKNCEELQKRFLQTYPEIDSFSVLVNQRLDNVILDGKLVQLYGKPYIQETILGCTFRIHVRSFFQINPYATEVLYKTALDYADFSESDVLVDMYCGTGTMGILAANRVKKVYGIEIVPDAIRDAKLNAQDNKISNIDFTLGDALQGAKALIRSEIKPQVMIVDPPRKGCSRDTLEAIIKISPDRLVYVSCDPATLARDSAYLIENGYSIVKVQPVDMFPGTDAVETVVLLGKTVTRS